jgi:UDP-N-acetylglucosamine:LPS N-acetylglucosamine transferase
MIFQVLWVLIKERPDVVISTGAAPGLIALRLGKWMGARTVWLDSIANVEALSMSGRKALPFADLTLSQWPDVAAREGCQYKGAVL